MIIFSYLHFLVAFAVIFHCPSFCFHFYSPILYFFVIRLLHYRLLCLAIFGLSRLHHLSSPLCLMITFLFYCCLPSFCLLRLFHCFILYYVLYMYIVIILTTLFVSLYFLSPSSYKIFFKSYLYNVCLDIADFYFSLIIFLLLKESIRIFSGFAYLQSLLPSSISSFVCLFFTVIFYIIMEFYFNFYVIVCCITSVSFLVFYR